MTSDPEAGRQLRHAIERYAEDEMGTRPQGIAAVLDCFTPDDRSRRYLGSFLGDIVFRYFFAPASAQFDEAAIDSAQVDRLVDDVFLRRTRLTERRVDNFRKISKQSVQTSNGERPRSEVRDRHLAKQRNDNCYLCGESVDESDERIAHVSPHSVGC